MTRLATIALLSLLPHVVLAEGVRLHYTWPTKDVRGGPAELVSGEAAVNGKRLASLDITKNQSDHQIPAGECIRASDIISVTATDKDGHTSTPAITQLKRDRCTPAKPVTAPGQSPQSFRIVGDTVQCSVHPTAVEVRLFILETGGKLGSKLATFKGCGGKYAGFIKGRTYVTKALYPKSVLPVLSGRSNEAVAP